MVDKLSPERRSALMAKVRSKNTTPEMIVRRAAHKLGYRYRLHQRKLPGSPDLVFSGRQKVIFVHGCFWHRHPECAKASVPKSQIEFWTQKFESNVRRDAENIEKLLSAGWSVLVIWQCETRSPAELKHKLIRFLDPPN